MNQAMLIIIYTLLALWAGNRVVSGRSAWLDGDGLANKAVKLSLSLIIGYFCAGFIVIGAILLFVWRLVKF